MTLTTVLEHEERRRPLTGIQPHNRPEATQPTGPTIFVVDDEPFIRNVLKLLLESNGYRVLQAGNGKEALELYQTHHATVDLVLLDVRMPGLSGPETLANLQQVRPDLCCCFMTGDLGQYTPADLLECGAVHLFSKPIFLADMIRTLKGILTP